MKTNRRLFQLPDLIIMILIVIISVIAVIIQFNRKDDLVCVIRYNGDTVYRYDLEGITDPVNLNLEFDERVSILIENDGVSVTDSTCRDHICVKTGKIKNAGQSIVCLPARLSVSLEGDTEDDVDTLVY